MLIDERVYLKHYGTKGMKWGRRKTASSDTKKMSKKKKVAIGVGVGALAVGGVATAVYLRKHGHTKVSSIPKLSAEDNYKLYRANARIISENSDVRYHSIKAAEASGRLTADQSRRIRELNTRRMINESNRLTREYRRSLM